MSTEFPTVNQRDAFYEGFQTFADHDIYQTDDYKAAELEFDAENYRTIPHYFKKGVANVVSRISLIRDMEDEPTRMKLLKQRENGGIPAAWFDIMLGWEPEADPTGVAKLRECRDHDYQKIIEEMSEDVDSLEETELLRHAGAMVRAEDIAINFYQVKRVITGV